MCTIEKEEGVHVFEIDGYSLKKGMGVGKFVQSATFTVGGYDWAILFYPDGDNEDSKDDVRISVKLMSKIAEVRVFCHLGLGVFNQDLGFPCCGGFLKLLVVFKKSHGLGVNLRRLDLEGSEYIQDDRLIIECFLMVIKEPRVYKIEVPPSDITEHIGKMLEAKEGADVTFSVGRETFKHTRFCLRRAHLSSKQSSMGR